MWSKVKASYGIIKIKQWLQSKEFALEGEGANILFEVTVKKGQKTGAYIAELSDFNLEKEYLMKPNLKYNVVSKKETEDGLLVYGLEVLENGSW